ncbi:vanadium-dependent haloperoxidase [Phaeobacter inhibens]|uniref:vanadium-dependent haloperoxidase n=1 Tax=Phaeobacter inhibens TaxID=221822 RepID=UPI0021A847E3|nr:vanadium-dependent haloperoxidase [Phaeobacter inhibens]UWS09941.1 vanadium-dependent haloperoxidase [Phaeobacter inhibens]
MLTLTPWRRQLLAHTCITGLATALFFTASGSAQAELAADWQETAMRFVVEEKWPGAQRQRTLALLHAAMFDAANAIDGSYHAYAYAGPQRPGADRRAAVTQAALVVMQTLMPEREADLTAAAEAILGDITDDEAREAGVQLGALAAEAVLEKRAADGADFASDFTPGQADNGVYQPTSERPMVAPKIRNMQPFALTSATQFDVPPPPELNSFQFQRDLAEVAKLGGALSQSNPELIAIAKLHAGSGSGAWNQIARDSSRACALPLVEEARTLALLNIALTDALVAGFNAKYTYQFWRPETAIAALGKGYDHPTLDKMDGWTPLVAAPMHPEYPCQHCTSGSAAQQVMETVFGADEFTFSFEGKDGYSRNYQTFAQFAEEEAESRVIGGVHYRRSNTVGDMLGYQIGSHISAEFLTPANAGPGDDSAAATECAGVLTSKLSQ